MIIYKTTNLINGKIYVGKDCNNNPKYLGSGSILKIAINKYGKKNFKKETIEICDANNWCEREIYWIEKLGSRNGEVGYNIAIGGEGFERGKNHPFYGKPSHSAGKKLSEEHKNRISKSMVGIKSPLKGSVKSEEFRKKISLGLMGRKVSKETREKLSKAHTGRFWSEDKKKKMREIIKNSIKHKMAVNSEEFKNRTRLIHTGKIVPQEVRDKIAKANIGAKRSAEARAKMSAWQKGGTHSEEYKKKMSESLKRSWSIRKGIVKDIIQDGDSDD